MLFPRLFANMFSFIPYIGQIIKYLPEIIDLMKATIEMAKRGATEIQIKVAIRKISIAIKNPNRVEAARQLNDIFRL